MSYTIESIRQAAATVCTAQSITFKAGYIEDVNRVLGQATSGKLLIMILPDFVEFEHDCQRSVTIKLFYFEQYLTSDSRDEFKAVSENIENFATFISAFLNGNRTKFNTDYPFKIEDPRYDRNMDKCSSSMCSLKLQYASS